ncbi:zinc ribbon domain-containing protein [Burkholderia multivorans]|nr:zinc ribbon domain-containing protein [Burkholderia multivorans]
MDGGEVIALPLDGTSTTCPECGHESEANRPNLRKWFECVVCGHREHSGMVAARNLLRRAGHARLAYSGRPGSQAQGSNARGGVLTGTNPAGAMPGIPRL